MSNWDQGHGHGQSVAKTVITIPLYDSPEDVLQLDLQELPCDEVIKILKTEMAPLELWHNAGLEYYKLGRGEDFLQVLDTAKTIGFRSMGHTTPPRDLMRILDSMGAYYAKLANKEKNMAKKAQLFKRATEFYNITDKFDNRMLDQNHWVGRAFLCLLEGDKMSHADVQFNYVIDSSLTTTIQCVPALLGKACIAYNRKNYRGALTFYRKALMANPNCSADVRAAIAHCFAQLGDKEKAEFAFRRALELNPECMSALVGMSIFFLNARALQTTRKGVQLLSKAYRVDPGNPVVLNHLANHFFFKRDLEKVRQLAFHAFHNTENEFMRAESCYQLARSYHVQGEFIQAFQYYYQANQYASPKFILPLFGLGQMYIERGDLENAEQCFAKVLLQEKENYETLKILGSLYGRSSSREKREMARDYMKKVTTIEPNDLDAWIELGQIMEEFDMSESLKCYMTGQALLVEEGNFPVPAELYNNIGSIHFRLGDYDQAVFYFQESLARSKTETKEVRDDNYANTVTTNYNLGRSYEAMCRYEDAQTIYLAILKEHPNYVDCFFRLGVMAREKGQIYQASSWFKDGLEVSSDQPEAWTLIGNLHMIKSEWGPAQKKFERILNNTPAQNDPYSLVALGNIWLQTLPMPRDKMKEKRHQERAYVIYRQVLRNDPKNIWALNGLGALLAYKGFISEARDVFSQVREAIADFSDVWLNLAHIYVEQKQYVSAATMYENCIKRFYLHYPVEILQYLARAHYKNNKLREAKMVLLRALRVTPYDTLIIYNLALILRRMASETLSDDNANLMEVLGAVRDLALAEKYFRRLSTKVEKEDKALLNQNHKTDHAADEAQYCTDLLSQAQYHVGRARMQEENERIIRQRQEEEREQMKAIKLEQERLAIERNNQYIQDLNKKREDYVARTKHACMFASEPPLVKPQGGKKKRTKSGDNNGDNESVDEKEKLGLKRKRKRVAKTKPGSASEDSPRKSTKKRKGKPTKKNRQVGGTSTRKQKKNGNGDESRLKIVSKETISTSEDSDGSSKLKGEASTRSQRRSRTRSGSSKQVISSSDESRHGETRKRIPKVEDSSSRSGSESRSRSRTVSRKSGSSSSRSNSTSSSRRFSRTQNGSRSASSRSRTRSGSTRKSVSSRNSKSRSRSRSGSESRAEEVHSDGPPVLSQIDGQPSTRSNDRSLPTLSKHGSSSRSNSPGSPGSLHIALDEDEDPRSEPQSQ